MTIAVYIAEKDGKLAGLCARHYSKCAKWIQGMIDSGCTVKPLTKEEYDEWNRTTTS